jgi:hypothetical protein
MTTEKTELKFPYSPADFFEAQYRRATDEYVLVAVGGVVRITLSAPSDPIDARLQNRITKEVEGLLRVRQLLTHRPFHLNDASVYQHHSDGTKSISLCAAAGEFLSAVGQCDFVVRNASGAVVQDSKAERIEEHADFVDAVLPKVANSPILTALLASYNSAVNDPANELVHLYEIRDALRKHYGTDAETRRKLGITQKEWKRLGYLANDAPLNEGRHRGRHTNLRHVNAGELDEARKIARGLILSFANQV